MRWDQPTTFRLPAWYRHTLTGGLQVENHTQHELSVTVTVGAGGRMTLRIDQMIGTEHD